MRLPKGCMSLGSSRSEKSAKANSTTPSEMASKAPENQNGTEATHGGSMWKIGFVARIRRKFAAYHHNHRTPHKSNDVGNRSAASTKASRPPTSAALPATTKSEVTEQKNQPDTEVTSPTSPPGSDRRTGARRPVVPGLPRQQTFARQQSEMRTNLKPVTDPRSQSRDPRGGPQASNRSLQPVQATSPSLTGVDNLEKKRSEQDGEANLSDTTIKHENKPISSSDNLALIPGLEAAASNPKESTPQILDADESALSDTEDVPTLRNSPSAGIENSSRYDGIVSPEIEEEMEWKWILNLSMHFRDESNREKFFVTYTPRKNESRRITISCDYRDAEEGTLEREISALRFQRDKSAKIYEAIRESLQDIRFYDTITNLKLETSEGRLHVHVTEDVNEIIRFPPARAISHLQCPKYRESELEFDSHLSGFVYKVRVNGEIMIKKEIPGPDTVDEFLYEINALYSLASSNNVIRFKGCVVDDDRERVKGLLIVYAPKGALIDILFNERGNLPWLVREKWAKQIVTGLSDIHEAGYVQGDFTLSNIVIDEHDNAQIIDINRRGCPVNWEPPEISAMIDGLQRIGMYIGVKSDIFQLGMVLWGIAHEDDEPEQMPRPLQMDQSPKDVPAYFRDIVEACLCERPQGRASAKELISMFPESISDPPEIVYNPYYGGRQLPALPNSSNGYFPPATQPKSPRHRPIDASAPPSDDEFVSSPPTLRHIPSGVSDSSVGGVAVRGSRAQSPRYPVPQQQQTRAVFQPYNDDETATTTEASLYDDTSATEDGRDTPTVTRGRWVDAKETLSPLQMPAA